MTGPEPLRSLPPVHAVAGQVCLSETIDRVGRAEVVAAVRTAIEEARTELRRGDQPLVDPAGLADRARRIIESDRPDLRPVINATGILLNTGLGRAPLAEEAIDAIARVARGYCNLEVEIATNERGSRTTGVERLLRRLTGAEAATVANNNAAATVLTLRALAAGREAVVSRGELVEIGGSFRLPEIFEAAGVRLREVGTTNRTRLDDYARAIGPETAALLRVHPSNYRVVGFTESTSIADLAGLARSRGLWSIDDVGSGRLGDDRPEALGDEPTVTAGLAAGADVVLFSGDKLLGGPQSGLIVGRRSAIDLIRADPLMRAVRVDKLTLAALEATLTLIARGRPVPLGRFLDEPVEALRDRAEVIARRLLAAGFDARAEPTEAMLGGGSTPARPIASWAVRVAPPYPGGLSGLGEADLATALRSGEPALVCRVRNGAAWLDLRAVFPADDAAMTLSIERRARPPSD